MDTETYVALRTANQTLTPEEISSLVGTSADKARRKGDYEGNSRRWEHPVFEKNRAD